MNRDREESDDSKSPGSGQSHAPVKESRRVEQPASAAPYEISVLQLTNFALRHRKILVVTPILVAFFLVAVTLVSAPTYTATTSFTPQSAEVQASRLSGLASQFGVTVPGDEVGQSPQFYAHLLRSRDLLRRTVVTNFAVSTRPSSPGGESVQGDLVGLLDVQGDTHAAAVAKTIQALHERVNISTDPETSVVEVSVTTEWPALSHQVAERMLELVNRFNLEVRKTQAAAEREFIDGQVARAESSLHAAEDSLEAFLDQNRRYRNSPGLTFQMERLQRRVSLRQQVFTSLSESYEQAKIEEVRNTPVITVVQPPELPARPDPRRLPLRGVLGLILGGVIGVLWAFGREVVAASRDLDPGDYEEFARLKRETKEDFRGLWRWLQRKAG